MNDLEMATYGEPDWGLAQEIIDEFNEKNMTEEEKEERRKKTIEMYKNFMMDDEYLARLGECF